MDSLRTPSNTGNVIFVTFVPSHSAYRQPDQEPPAAAATNGDVIQHPVSDAHARRNGSDRHENQLDVPDGQ